MPEDFQFPFQASRARPPARLPQVRPPQIVQQISGFAMPRGLKEPSAASADAEAGDPPMPDMDDPRMMRAMAEMERDMEHLDENNPSHMAHMMKKMKDLMPAGTVPKELDVAIKRLEAGEDPEKIEAGHGRRSGRFHGRRRRRARRRLLARQRPLRHVAALCERRRIESALLSTTIAKAGQKPLNWRE